MSFNSFAAKAVRGIARHRGNKLRRKGVSADPLPKAEPSFISGVQYKCGYAVKEVMPADLTAKKYWIAGHGMGKTIDRVHDPITVSAMWIGADDNGGLILCSADVIGLTNVEVQTVRDSLKDFQVASGCKTISISCTHTHGGFDTVGYWGQLKKLQTGKNPEYMKQLLDSLAAVCKEAYENRKAGHLFVGSVDVPECAYAKRSAVFPHAILTRLRFVPDDGSTETWFMNFCAHPNTLGGDNHDCSADYPYWLRHTINETKKVNVLFALGANGAVDPGMFDEEQPRPARTQMQGEKLGAAALAISNDEELSPEITVLRQPYFAPVDNGLLALMGVIKVVSTKCYPCDTGDLGVALKTEMTYIRLGKQQILQLPGECFPAVVYGGAQSAAESTTGKGPEINPKPLIEVADDPNLLVFGITNDMTGYCIPPNDYVLNPTEAYVEQGRDVHGDRHYHETNSLGLLTDETIVNVFSDLLTRVKKA